MANEKVGQTLQPTALVHEAWLKIAGKASSTSPTAGTSSRRPLRPCKQILIDIARRKQRLKHGANLVGDELHESRIAMSVPSEELLAVNDALAASGARRSPGRGSGSNALLRRHDRSRRLPPLSTWRPARWIGNGPLPGPG
jgi:hypothetical protein